MRKKNLLDKIQQETKAVCPTASWRDPSKRVLDYAEEFLRENVPFGLEPTEFEIDSDHGELCVSWVSSTSWRDIMYPARQLASMLSKDEPWPNSEVGCAIRNIKVKLYYEIPMFTTSQHSFSDGCPLREDFVENLKAFVRDFEEIEKSVLTQVIKPLKQNLCNQVKTHDPAL